jgi:hypothetical protein
MDLRALPYTLPLNKRPQWLMLAAGLGLIPLGCWLVSRGDLMGWLCLGVGVVIGLIALATLLPGAHALTLEEDGILIRTFYREQRIRWEEIGSFGTYELEFGKRKSRFVGFNFAEGARPTTALMRQSRQTIGYEAGVPAVAGFTAEELAALLEAYRLQQTEPDEE